MNPPASDLPARGTRRARWGIFATTVVMGAALVVTGVTTWVQQRDAARSVSEARAFDLFRAVRRSLRAAGPPLLRGMLERDEPFDLSEILEELEEAGLRYVGIAAHGEVVAEAGAPRGRSAFAHAWHPPREPAVIRLDDERVRIEGGLRIRRPGRGAMLVLELEPIVARELEASALEHLVVSSVAAAVLLALAFVLWTIAARADRFQLALMDQRRLAALGEMSAVLGHEIRNPLAALKGHAQLVLERIEPEHRAHRSAKQVVHEAERIETLSGHILDFARTNAVSPAPVDPRAMLQAVADKVAHPGVTLDTARAPASWSLDRVRMEQVIGNILKNAVQSQGDGDGAIEMSCLAAGDELLIRVRDHGTGFAPGEEETVFEPFRTRRVQGTGLGLTIARRIVEAHGGSITARNAGPDDGAGSGAIVEVRLPRSASRAGVS